MSPKITLQYGSGFLLCSIYNSEISLRLRELGTMYRYIQHQLVKTWGTTGKYIIYKYIAYFPAPFPTLLFATGNAG